MFQSNFYFSAAAVVCTESVGTGERKRERASERLVTLPTVTYRKMQACSSGLERQCEQHHTRRVVVVVVFFTFVGFDHGKDFLSPVKVTLFLIMFQMKEGQVRFEVM